MKPWSNRLDPMTMWLVKSYLLIEENKMLLTAYSRSGSLNTRQPQRSWFRSFGSAFAKWCRWEVPAGSRSIAAKF